jgi:hypothetical protein
MNYEDQICVPDGLVSPEGLDPREEFEPIYLLEAAIGDAPGQSLEIPDIPIEALMHYLSSFNDDLSDPLSFAKGIIKAEVLGSHTAIRGVAETLRRDLVYATGLYDKAGKRLTPEIRMFVKSAQASAEKSLSNVRVNTRSFRILTQKGISLQFGATSNPWAKNLRGRIAKPPVSLYSLSDLFENPALAVNKQAYYRNAESVLVLPKPLSRALNAFGRVLVVAEIAPIVYDIYNAVKDEDYEVAFNRSLDGLAKVGAGIVGNAVTNVSFGMCVEAGVSVTVLASPAIGLPFTIACGVGAVAAGIYVGSKIEELPVKLTPVQNLELRMP